MSWDVGGIDDLFGPVRLGKMLDDGTLPIVVSLMDLTAPEPSYLTFGAPGVARVLAGYGRTLLAGRSAFSSPWQDEDPDQRVEVRVANLDDPMAFPPNRFGLIHLRWTATGDNVLLNALRWLRPGGLLLVERPDPYPAASLKRGPYQAVASAVAECLDLPSEADLPARLLRHGFHGVRCRHEPPSASASRVLLANLVHRGASWPDLPDADVENWKQDPAAQTPFLMNVMAWGIKPVG